MDLFDHGNLFIRRRQLKYLHAHLKKIRALGGSIDQQKQGHSLLSIAVGDNALESARILLAAGAAINAPVVHRAFNISQVVGQPFTGRHMVLMLLARAKDRDRLIEATRRLINTDVLPEHLKVERQRYLDEIEEFLSE